MFIAYLNNRVLFKGNDQRDDKNRRGRRKRLGKLVPKVKKWKLNSNAKTRKRNEIMHFEYTYLRFNL